MERRERGFSRVSRERLRQVPIMYLRQDWPSIETSMDYLICVGLCKPDPERTEGPPQAVNLRAPQEEADVIPLSPLDPEL